MGQELGAPVFAASRAALDGWTVLFHILSQEGERTDLLPGLLFVLNEFPFIAVDGGFELSGRRQFMYPGFRASKSFCSSLGIQNLYR